MDSYDTTSFDESSNAFYDPGVSGDVAGWYPSDPASGSGAIYDPGAYNDSTVGDSPADPSAGYGAIYDPGAPNDSSISGWDDPQVSGSVYDPGSDTYTTAD